MTLVRGQKSIGMSTAVTPSATLPSAAEDPQAIIDLLLSRIANLETLVEGKADAKKLKTLIQYSDEAILIQAKNIAINGAVTFLDTWLDQTGRVTGVLHPSITRIRGGVIQTGIITSNNWGTSAGTALDLDNGTITIGGSSSPALYFDGTDLEIAGEIKAGSIIAGSVTVGGVALSTISSNASTGAGHASSTGNVHSVSMAQISGDLDDIADGSSYFRATATTLDGGTRAVTGLDSNGKYIKEISTQLIAVSGTNPTNGVIIDSAGLRGYGGGTLKFNISSSTGDATFSGDVVTGGQVLATGSTSSGGYQGSIVGHPSNTALYGVVGISSSAYGVFGISSSDAGVFGVSTTGSGVRGNSANASGVGVTASNFGGGTALEVIGTADFGSSLITKSRVNGQLIKVYDTTTHALVATYEYSFE